MKKPRPRLACRFYATESGQEPVREWLRDLDDETCTAIGSDIQKVQWRWPISKPLVRTFGDGLYEVRTSLAGNICRVLFCTHDGALVLLHGFQKKSQKTAGRDIALARARQREIEGKRP